jgi:hypothetical protein
VDEPATPRTKYNHEEQLLLHLMPDKQTDGAARQDHQKKPLKRCKTCCARADAQRAVLADGQANKSRREFSAFADEMRRLEQRGLLAD